MQEVSKNVVGSILGTQLVDIAKYIDGLNKVYGADDPEEYGVKNFQWGDGFRAIIRTGTRFPVESDAGDLLGYIILGEFQWEFTMNGDNNG